MNNTEIQNLQEQITLLKNELNDLKGVFYKNNFSSSQIFVKDCNFATKLKIPIYSTLPNCEVGEIVAYSNLGTYTLMIATDTNVWTVVGTQS